MKRKAIYSGSFDPFTIGHLWIVQQGSKMVDELIVVIGDNSSKKHTFTLEERTSLVIESVKDYSNVKVMQSTGQYLVSLAKDLGVEYLVRGIRNEIDYLEEKEMRYINSQLNSKIETIFLIPPKHLLEVSSSTLKQLVGPPGWEKVIAEYVEGPVHSKMLFHGLIERFSLFWSTLSEEPEIAKLKAPEVLATLIKYYIGSDRHYHNISHILDCVNELQSFKLENIDHYKLFVALWFHDVIYDTRKNDNEQESANLFVKFAIESRMKDEHINEIVGMILATKSHIGKTELEEYLLDIDLSILGQDKESLDRYDSNIRKEYSWVPDTEYNTARNKIMNNFYARTYIFKTKSFADKYEKKAKEYLKKFKISS